LTAASETGAAAAVNVGSAAENESVNVGSAEAANGFGTALQVNEDEGDAKVESRGDSALWKGNCAVKKGWGLVHVMLKADEEKEKAELLKGTQPVVADDEPKRARGPKLPVE
jgi:hypothetical protein